MKSKVYIFLIAFSVLSSAAQLSQAEAEEDEQISIANPGFERAGRGGIPEGWNLTTIMPGGNSVKVDRTYARSGNASLLISNATPASVIVRSGEIELRVGHLYRLSGWIRTESAFADPTSRYPTAVPACLTMASFPFTNHSPTVGASSDWSKVETLFIATASKDRLRVHLGYNGEAGGKAWFDDVSVEKVEDVSEYIPLETVRWFGEGYRYDDKGWIFVHIEGEPYERGYQYGYLVSDEIASYITKLGIQGNAPEPVSGWNSIRFMTDTMMLRKYDEEFLNEMKGIADGAAHAGAKAFGRSVDLLDIVSLNSVIDLGQMHSAMRVTPHALTGKDFLSAEDELLIPDGMRKCSGITATGPATADGRIVFGQIFMWYGYTGVHWNVICDIVPTEGHRLVYQTFPGGIHSGADFYINSAGIMIGETTVSQTPYNAEGTPQSNRIRKAAQYAESIDDVVRTLSEKNNGMYTNDWPMADTKTDEAAIFLLGTRKSKLWRTSVDIDPFGTPGFLWADNNNRDPEVRKEYAAQPDGAPYDVVFTPWNRDVKFNEFYQEFKGKIDAINTANLWASWPINLAHACDGKITTSEMAEQLVFLAHFGKLTLREKFPEKGSRRMPDLPGAEPHLSLGYSVPSPIFITEKLKEMREKQKAEVVAEGAAPDATLDFKPVADFYQINKRKLWRGTVFPVSNADNWFVSGSATYWRILNNIPDDLDTAADHIRDELKALNSRLLYVLASEEDIAPYEAKRVYDRYGHYRIPRIKGTFALHQLRLWLGNEKFFKLMGEFYKQFANKEAPASYVTLLAQQLFETDISTIIQQWIMRKGLPDPRPTVRVGKADDGAWRVLLEVTQERDPYILISSVLIEAGSKITMHPIKIEGERSEFEFTLSEKPIRVIFNPGCDFPVKYDNFFTQGNISDDYHDTVIVYGTTRQIEANHTLALNYRTKLADSYMEIFPPVVRDSEVTDEQLAANNIILLGHPDDNSLVAELASDLPLKFTKNTFSFRGRTYINPDDGVILTVPNPRNPKKMLYLVIANSAKQLYHMTNAYQRGLPTWAVYKGERIVRKGYFYYPERFIFDLSEQVQ